MSVAVVNSNHSVLNTSDVVIGSLEGRAVEKISIDDLSHWKKVIDARIEGHEAMATRHKMKNCLYLIAGVIVAAAAAVLGILFAATVASPLLSLAISFSAVSIGGGISFYTQLKGYAEDLNAKSQNKMIKDLQNKQTILKSEEEFGQFVAMYKNRGVIPRLTEKQFIQSLDLYSEQKRLLADEKSALEAKACFEEKLEFLKSGISY